MIGRTFEVDTIECHLDNAVHGRGSLVFVGGEPGIGKTTLARRVADRAGAVGATVVWGQCREDRGAPALWPWIQVLRSLGLGAGQDLSSLVGPAGSDIEALLSGRGGADDDGDVDLSNSRRFRLFDGISRLLAPVASPVCVLVDDVHRADDESVAMLRFLAGEIGMRPLLVVATLREGEVVPEGTLARMLGEVSTDRSIVYLPLGPLSRDESRSHAVALVGGHPVHAQTIDAAVERAAGHPFFLEELIRAALSRPQSSELPITVRQAVAARVAGVDPKCIEALQAFAVLGREADSQAVQELLGVDGPTLARILVPAIRSGLVGQDTMLLRFRHALVRDALYDSIDVERRRRFHELCAQRPLEAATADALVDRAHHCMAAAELGARVDVVGAAWQAGRAAAALMSYNEASRWFDIAVDMARPAELDVDLLHDSGDAHLFSGAAATARQRFEEAFAIGSCAGDGAIMAKAALGVGRCIVTAGAADWALVSMLESARAALPDGRCGEAARLLARHGIELYWYDAELSRELTAQAAAMLDDSMPPVTRSEVLYAQMFCLRGPGRLEVRVRIGTELVDMAVRGQRLDDEFRCRTLLIPELLQLPDLAAYRTEITALSDLADRSHQPLHRWYADLYQAQSAIAHGDHDRGRAMASSALRHGRQAQAPVATVYHLGQEYLIRRDVGGIADLVDEVELASARFPVFVTLRALLALMYSDLGRHADAVAEVTRLATQRFAAVPKDSLWIASLGMCAEVAFRSRMASTGSLLAALLEPHGGTCAVQGLPTCFGSVDRFIGLAEAAHGATASGRSRLESALEQHRRWGFASLRVRTEFEFLSLVLHEEAPPPGVIEHVLARLVQLRDEARSAGWHRLGTDIEQAVSSASIVEPARPSGPGGTLTPRESAVLALIAEGATNRQLGEQLSISINTVERHVRNIFVKLGVANRAEAVATHMRHHAKITVHRDAGGRRLR